jgi:hypothetical protein
MALELCSNIHHRKKGTAVDDGDAQRLFLVTNEASPLYETRLSFSHIYTRSSTCCLHQSRPTLFSDKCLRPIVAGEMQFSVGDDARLSRARYAVGRLP